MQVLRTPSSADPGLLALLDSQTPSEHSRFARNRVGETDRGGGVGGGSDRTENGLGRDSTIQTGHDPRRIRGAWRRITSSASPGPD